MAAQKKVRRPSQARSRATVEAILEAASQVLRREGLEGCTTTKIAVRAGVSVGTLYQYFPNKETVYEALIDGLLEERVATRTVLLSAPQEPAGRIGPAIAALIDALLAVHLVDPELQHQLHRYEASVGFERLETYQAQMMGLAAGLLRRHADRFRPLDPELAARILVHAITGVVEPMAREDPAMLARPEIRREVAALVAGYLNPGNPVVSAAEPGDP